MVVNFSGSVAQQARFADLHHPRTSDFQAALLEAAGSSSAYLDARTANLGNVIDLDFSAGGQSLTCRVTNFTAFDPEILVSGLRGAAADLYQEVSGVPGAINATRNLGVYTPDGHELALTAFRHSGGSISFAAFESSTRIWPT